MSHPDAAVGILLESRELTLRLPLALYLVALPLAGHHWVRGAIEELARPLALSRQVRCGSRQYVAFSIALLVVLIPAALFDVLDVAAADAAHEAGEFLAVANGLRAGRS